MSKIRSLFNKRLLAMVLSAVMVLGITLPASADAAEVKYYSNYGSLDEVWAASKEINQQIAEESVVLMKNADDTLPLADARYVSVFGKAASDPYYAGGGSGTAEGYYSDDMYTSVYASLEAAGYSVNPVLRDMYDREASAAALTGSSFSYSVVGEQIQYSGNAAQISEVDPASFTGSVLDSYGRYNDAAIVVLGRTGSEGGDRDMGQTREAFIAQALLSMQNSGATQEEMDARRALLENALDTDPAFAAAALRHGLMLTWEEEQLIKHVAENFDTVIIVLNVPQQIELAWVEDGSLGDIDACMWVGHPGLNGFIAIGEVLNGTVNPSGRTVDIWQADMTKDPTYYNINENLQVANGTTDYVYTDESGEHLVHAVEYEEGIYYGYRYYETAAVEGFINYDEAVVYPFGHGLSYTSFEKTLDSVEKKTDADGHVYYEAKVTVTNTGSVAGKEVVQLYLTAPYTKGGIEKAHVTLVAFDKTETLKPGKSETITLTVYEQDMASYDYNDANANGHTGYELDAGAYALKLMDNSHDVIAQYDFTLEAINYDTDRITGAEVNNLFSDTEDPTYNSLYLVYDENGEVMYDGKGGLMHDMVVMSRADFAGTFPTTPVVTVGENGKVGSEGTVVLEMSAETYNDLVIPFEVGSTEDEADEAWYDYYMDWYNSENAETQTWTQGKLADPVINLSDMTGLSWDDPKWVDFLNQLSWEQLSRFLNYSGYWSTSLSDELSRRKGSSLESQGVALIDGQTLGVPFTEQADGPVALKRQNTGTGGIEDVGIQWTSTMNIAATWNTELAEIRGRMIGEEALALELDGWYGVAMNIHRSPWGGRNFEYFSEDPFLSGSIATAEVIGVQSKGVTAFIKHFMANHQDTDRGPALPGMTMPGSSDYGLVTMVDEQTLREIYAKSFQMSVEQGGALGLMNSMNHIGVRGNSNNFNLMTALLREEWGFKGYTVTDIVPAKSGSSYADPETLPRIGADLPLNANSGIPVSGDWNAEANCVEVNGERNDIAWAAVRMSVKRAMYVNANSSAMRNNLDLTNFGAKSELTATLDIATNAKLIDDLSAFGTDDVSFVLTGDLPQGVTFNAYTGTFSGTPTEDGTYDLEVSLTADGGWISYTANFTLTVKNDLFEVPALNVKVGEAVSAAITSPVLAEEGSSVTYTAENLPEGVTMDGSGNISGAPTQAGVYDVIVRATVETASADTTTTTTTATTDDSTGEAAAEVATETTDDSTGEAATTDDSTGEAATATTEESTESSGDSAGGSGSGEAAPTEYLLHMQFVVTAN